MIKVPQQPINNFMRKAGLSQSNFMRKAGPVIRPGPVIGMSISPAKHFAKPIERM